MEMVVAVAKNGVIGDTATNKMLWHIPEDLSRFYRMTKGNVVIMGHNTFRSLPNGPLKNRINIVLTRDPPVCLIPEEAEEEPLKEALFFVNMAKLWDVLIRFIDKNVYVIGGSTIYKLLYPFCRVVHYTLVDLEPVGDVIFPFSREFLYNSSREDVAEEDWQTSSKASIPINYKYITYNINK
jgi:dihydrofolate reductase